jgi:hypothetical protein
MSFGKTVRGRDYSSIGTACKKELVPGVRALLLGYPHAQYEANFEIYRVRQGNLTVSN